MRTSREIPDSGHQGARGHVPYLLGQLLDIDLELGSGCPWAGR